MSELPNDIVESLLSIGRVEWGTTEAQSDAKHVEDFKNTLRITREHFDFTDKRSIHGVYLEGEPIVLCHTGHSPNSPQHARILAGAWNQLVELAQAQKSFESGANAAANSPAPEVSEASPTRTGNPTEGESHG